MFYDCTSYNLLSYTSPSLINQLPPTHVNDVPLHNEELTELNKVGESGLMPRAVLNLTPLVTSTQPHSTHHATRIILPEGLLQNLEDLLDLSDSGESVTWPTGFDGGMAKEFWSDYNYAIEVCLLHRGFTHPPLA